MRNLLAVNRRCGIQQSTPFLRWVGGKRWLVDAYPDLFPQSYNRYIEPFLGSGAALFHLGPKNALLGDTNAALIDTYRAIKSDWKRVWSVLLKHHRRHNADYYYRIRESKPRARHTKAAKFIYLNRTCFNGIYRVNRDGGFNVPLGSRASVIRPDDDFAAVSSVLQLCRFQCCDFQTLLAKAKDGDLVYVDPPYTVKHNDNNFVRYNEVLFRWQDQVRLAAAVVEAGTRGAQIVVSNANHQCIRNLYSKFGKITVVGRNSSIASVNSYRGRTSELVISNIK